MNPSAPTPVRGSRLSFVAGIIGLFATEVGLADGLAGSSFAPPTGPAVGVTNPSATVPSLRNAPSDRRNIDRRYQPSQPDNATLRLIAPELATPTPGVPGDPAKALPDSR
jgi:hypothetical protein